MSAVASILLPGLVGAVLTAPFQVEPPSDPGRLYGRVETAAGQVFEGYIRWDRNEGGWGDLLHGTRELPYRNLRQAHELLGARTGGEDRSVEILGLRISWADDEGRYVDESSSAVRFGHLRSLVVLDDESARLRLKSGDEVVFEGGSTDVGDGIRAIVVEDPEAGTVELRWRDLDRVEFLPVPAAASPPESGRRLHGTVRTRNGAEFTGAVAWDVDEIVTGDVLDGRVDGRDREISFGRIRTIERYSPDAARVVLRDGQEMVLRGTNDVDHGNRGIAVADPGIGEVTVSWEEFDRLELSNGSTSGPGYEAFDGGRRLHGTVEDADGRSWTGLLRWDNDEEHTWEILDGHARGAELSIELGLVESIRKRSEASARVVLRDGRVFELDGSNDVGRGNRGLFVTGDDGEVTAVPWDEMREVRFHRE